MSTESPTPDIGPTSEPVGPPSLTTRVEVLQAKVDVLQKASEAKNSWYATPSTLISVVALVVSVVTTIFNQLETSYRERYAERIELSTIIQRMLAAPREALEANEKYKESAPIVAGSIGESLGQENEVLVNRALRIVQEIPDRVSPAEYLTIAEFLANLGSMGKARTLLEPIITPTFQADAWTVVKALNMYALTYFQQGDAAHGRDAFGHCLEHPVFKTLDSPMSVAILASMTQFRWGVGELIVGDCVAATDHINKALAGVASLPDLPSVLSLRSQVAQAWTMNKGCSPAQAVAPLAQAR